MKTLKILLITICLILFSSILNAEPVNEEDAKNAVSLFLKQIKSKRNFDFSKIDTICLNNKTLLYAISFKDSGWYIVSADNVGRPILGYSTKGNFDKDRDNPTIKMFINSYAKSLYTKTRSANVKKHDSWDAKNLILNLDSKQKSSVVSSKVLLPEDLIWKQGKNNDFGCPGYNNECVSSGASDAPCGKAWLGCGAVAMGQLMYYWKWPLQDNLMNILFNYPTLSAPPLVQLEGDIYWPACIPWDDIKPALTNGEDVTPVAHFLLMCARSIFSTPTSGGTYTVIPRIEDALHDIFYYQSTSTIKKNDYSSSEWEAKLRNEIDNNRPLIYFGAKSVFNGWHYFVLDGYRLLSDGSYLYCFNFGFGSGNEFMSIGDLDYDMFQRAIINIQPNYDSFSGDRHFNDDISSGILYCDYAQGKYSYNHVVKTNAHLMLTSSTGIELSSGFESQSGARCYFSYAAKAPFYASHSKGYIYQENQVQPKIDYNSPYKVYPNPASRYVCITVDLTLLPCKLEIYSIDGKCVMLTELSKETSVINTSKFSNGMHYIKIIKNNTIFNDKILIYK